MDSNKIWQASKFTIVISLIFNILIMLASIAISFIIDKQADAVPVLIIALMVLPYLANLIIYIYCGYRAGKKFKVTAIEGGATTAFSFAITHTIYTFLSFIISTLFFDQLLSMSSTNAADISSQSILATIFFVAGMISIIIYFMTLISGIMFNFIAGAIAAYWVTRKFY